MGLPSITRGIGGREDYLDGQTVITSNSGNFGSNTYTTDGDIMTFTSVLTNSTAADNFVPYRSVSLNSTTYPYIMARVKVATLDSGAGLQVQLYAHFTDSSTSRTVIATAPTTAMTVYTSPALPTGKTIDRIGVVVQSTVSQNGTFNVNYQVDFVMSFKELLTLPTAIRPLQEQKTRNIVIIPILGGEGQTQDLGLMPSAYIIAGGLVNTTSGQNGWTNTYTADQWWQLLKGIQIECGTIQADGNPTWQWFSSDDINGKVLIRGIGPQQVPGRLAYHDYALALTSFNILPETTANLPGITY